MKIQRERQQNRQPLLSDQDLATELSVQPERWAAAVQSHGASQVVDLSASPGEPASSSAEDEHLDWLRSVLHQVDGRAGTVLQAHLIEGQTLKDLAQAMNCSRSSLRLHLHEGVQLAAMGPARWSDAHPNQLIRAPSAASPELRPRGSGEH